MKQTRARIRCAIYTRKSSEEGLEQNFNSLDAQREACEAYITSQHGEGWQLVRTAYDDGGFSGGNVERPALKQLLSDIRAERIDIVIVYKVDRLSRSLADFVRLVDLFDKHDVSFVSVTQQFNTSTSMGRLTLNVLLSFAQFEREVTGERIRDKIAASKRKGMWMGGTVPLGYEVQDKQLIVKDSDAILVVQIYQMYLDLGSVRKLKLELDSQGIVSTKRPGGNGDRCPKSFTRGALYHLLSNPIYVGNIAHKGQLYDGRHSAIIDQSLWDEVQDQLSENRKSRRVRVSAAAPSLLAGVIYDDRGHPMSPSHAKKRSRRYRYYTSQAVLLYKDADAGSVIRAPAQTVETAVVDELKRRLTTPVALLELISPRTFGADRTEVLLERANELGNRWDTLPLSEQIGYLKDLIGRVVLSRNAIRITFSPDAFLAILLPNDSQVGSDDISRFEVVIPAELKRCGIESRLVISGAENTDAHPASTEAIQSALGKALVWNSGLINGEIKSIRAVAEREGVDDRHAARLIRLAWLAPDIMSSISKGNVPEGLSLSRLKQGFPLDWAEQRLALGFPSRSN